MMKFKYPCCFSYIAKFAFLVGLNGILLEMLQLKMCSFLNSWSNWKSVNFAHFLKIKVGKLLYYPSDTKEQVIISLFLF